MNNKYKEFKETQQNKLNDFAKQNMFFAFSQSQLEDWLKKLNTTKDKITQTSFWWFILIEKLNDYKNLNSFLDEELKVFLKDQKNLLDALKYELSNHEYCITYNYDDTLNSLNLSFDSLNEEQKEILQQAKKDYLENVIY